MKKLHIIFFLFIFSSLFSSQEDISLLSKVLSCPKYQEKSSQWVQSFRKWTDPELAENVICNPYDVSLPKNVANHGFEALKTRKILESHRDSLNFYDQQLLQNKLDYHTYALNREYKIHLKLELDSIEAEQRNIRQLIHDKENEDICSFVSKETTKENYDLSDLSSHGSNSILSDQSNGQSSFGSSLDYRNRLARAQQLKYQSDLANQASPLVQARQKEALKIIELDKKYKRKQGKVDNIKLIAQNYAVECTGLALNALDKVDRDKAEKLHRLDQEKKANSGVILFQGCCRGWKLRKELPGIQQQWRYQQELKKDQDVAVQKEVEKQIALNLLEQKKLSELAVKNAKKLKEKEQRYFKKLQKFVGNDLSVGLSEENFAKKIIPCIEQALQAIPCDEVAKKNIATRVIFNSAINLSQQTVAKSNPDIFRFFDKEKTFHEIVEPTCDKEMFSAFKKSKWARSLDLSDDNVRYLVEIEKQVFLSALCWSGKNTKVEIK